MSFCFSGGGGWGGSVLQCSSDFYQCLGELVETQVKYLPNNALNKC